MPWIEAITEPDDASAYTHKLDLELGAGLGLFNGLPKGNWLKNVTGYVTLDYLVIPNPEALFRLRGSKARLMDTNGPS